MKEPIDPIGQAVGDYIDVLEGKKPAGVAQIGGEAELTNEQRSRLPYVMAIYHDCYLCGAAPPPVGFYTWVIRDDKILSKPSPDAIVLGNHKTIITPVCIECSQIVGVKDRIESALRKAWQ